MFSLDRLYHILLYTYSIECLFTCLYQSQVVHVSILLYCCYFLHYRNLWDMTLDGLRQESRWMRLKWDTTRTQCTLISFCQHYIVLIFFVYMSSTLRSKNICVFFLTRKDVFPPNIQSHSFLFTIKGICFKLLNTLFCFYLYMYMHLSHIECLLTYHVHCEITN